MADDELDVGDGDVGAGAAPKKSGGLGGLLPVILKWVAIIIGAIILIVTVVVITMSVMNKNSQNVAVVQASAEYTGKREILDWYNAIGEIRTKTSDANPANVVVNVVLGYKQGDKQISTEITQRQIELKDFLRRFFTQRTAAQLKPVNEENLRIEIRNKINDEILSTAKIRDVRFLTLDVVEQ